MIIFYNHSLIDDGDDNPINDIHQVIVGTASFLHRDGIFNGDNGRWEPDSIYQERTNGYVLVEIDGDDVQFTWKHRVEPHVFEYGGDAYQFPTSIGAESIKNASFELYQNYPNPFNSMTSIGYQLSAVSNVDLSIYNTLGQKLSTLVSERQRAGNYKVEWDASEYASGVYIYTFRAEGNGHTFMQYRKLVLLK